jgi:putative ABC transport system ATP-binding protein
MAIIEINDISKVYGFGGATTVALDEVNLTIEQNEFVAIMGPSGSGKSTLMNVIGILDRPTHGTYKIGGRNVEKLSQNQRAKLRRDKIGFIFQSFSLLPRLTVLENVALPLAYRGLSTTRRLKAASSMINRLGLAEREYYLPRHLSGGQTQTAAIARALINTPSIIIADEPTGNLDSNDSRLIMELLSDIHKDGTTILMVTHNPELTRYATRVVYMRDGMIIHDELTALGRVAPTARKAMNYLPFKTEEDDLAGVSALMKVIPGGDSPVDKKSSRRSKATKKPKSRSTRSRSRKAKS